MAEFVHQSIEETLPELEQLERVGLFSKAEVKAIVKKRTAHEYRLGRLKKRREDFMRYVQYEINVLALIKKRRERNNYFHKKEEIENAVITRIHRFFRRACTKFPEDLKMWMSHLQFCKKWGRLMEMNRLYTRMLKIHSNNPGLWIMAAKFQLEDNQSSENARALFLRSLRHHPNVKKLWTEYFRMELLHADKLRKRLALLKRTMMEPEESEVEDALMRGELARHVYNNAVKEMPDDIPFRLAFLPIIRCFEFTSHLEDVVYQDLERDHPDKDQTWRALATRHLTQSGTEDEIWLSELSCHAVFDQAMERVQGVELWAHYADTCLERLALDGSDTLSIKRAEKALAVFTAAEERSKPTEEMYEKWVDVLHRRGMTDRALKVSERSTDVHPKSVNLWVKRLLVVMQTGQEDSSDAFRLQVRELFDSAVSQVKSKNSLDLWNLGLEWCLTSDPDTIQNLFECGLKEHKAVALPVKIRYLEWTALSKGMCKARKLYKRMATERPLSVEFFTKYIIMEESQPNPKAHRISEAYDDALKEFGETTPGLWLDYIRHEITHPEGSQGKAMQLHWKAMKTLDGIHVEEFTNGYTLMQTRDPAD